jgi:transcription termination factor NusB
LKNVTKNDVFKAADSLAAKSKMPSILTVRKVLGNKGSESTLQKYLKEWKINLLLSVNKCATNELMQENQKLRIAIKEAIDGAKNIMQDLQQQKI